MGEAIVLELGTKYRVTTITGTVFTRIFNGTWPGSSGDGRSFLDVMFDDKPPRPVASMALDVSEIHTAEPVESLG